jgi:hypothetical protein
MLHCRIIACNSSVSFESRYDTCSSCFPDDSCPHQSTHCAARPTRLRPLPHAPPPRERQRLHRFRTFPEVPGSFRKFRSFRMFLEVSGSSFSDVPFRTFPEGRGRVARHCRVHQKWATPRDKQRWIVSDIQRCITDATAAAQRARTSHPSGRKASAERALIRERTKSGCRGICGSGCMVIRTAAGGPAGRRAAD